MSRKRCYVYLVHHDSGLLSGTLLRRDETIFDPPAPRALGENEQAVIEQLESALEHAVVDGDEPLARFFWDEQLELHRVTVAVHPRGLVDKRVVVGATTIPVRLGYVACPLKEGGYRIMLPRFGWWMVVESLASARELLETAIAGALIGEAPRSLYDFRFAQRELLRPFAPALTRQTRRAERREESKDLRAWAVTSRLADEWVKLAGQHKLERVLGDEPQLGALLKLAGADPPRSLLLVGPSGSGKSALVRRLAFALSRSGQDGEAVPRIWRTSGERLVAGMRYLGMLEQQVFELLDELRYEGDYLYLERLNALTAVQTGGGSLGELIQGSVIAREISLISECDAAELEHCRRRLPRLVNALEIVRVDERRAAEMLELFVQYAERRLPGTSFSSGAVRQLLHYLDAFARDRAFPGKAFNLIDWLATQHLDEQALRESNATALYCRYSGLPARLVDDATRLSLDTIRHELERAVAGQPAACRVAAATVARFKARLHDPERPLGSLLFVGPTGVGKTELAKQLCRLMFGDDHQLVRLDMSEYIGPGSLDRFLASGSHSLGQKLRTRPLSVVLLDELEKADPRLFDVLLGALDTGRMTDLLGMSIDLRSALIVMTSNLGASDRGPAGFGDQAPAGYTQAVRQFFRPELVARIDAIIPFVPLGQAALEQIVELELRKVSARLGLTRRAVTLHVEPAARELLVARGHDPLRGARPLKRVIEELIVTPLAAELAARPTIERQRAVYRRRGTEIELTLES